MREQLIQYVNLLFAGAPDCEDMKQEILLNTLDRYDDLIAEGKVPEAAYRLAISGIGDISEILGAVPSATSVSACTEVPETRTEQETWKKLRAIAIALYILCPIPLVLMSEFGLETLGLCGLLFMVAMATALMIMGIKKEKYEDNEDDLVPMSPQQTMRKTIKSIINIVGLVIYFLVSFSTSAWYITWLIFPITAAVWELTKAIWDLKEATKHEV